ncbi:MAG: ThiF family adenylyltransferase [Deltaproteobacteria bacterium]|nr:MAG: ThiF family adenylyltransferase [Deltaproteobacteria bacterium]
MWSSLISRSPDLLRLQDDGYEIEVNGGYLLVHNVPYVNARLEVRRGTLASVLPDAGGRAGPPIDHTVLFAGEFPCHANGTEIEALRHGIPCETLKPGLQARFSFSNKAERPDPDFYVKMTRYIRIISDPAKALDDTATAASFRVVTPDQPSPLQYADTASSRAGIRAMTQKLAGLKIAIVGVGGTGSYVLDYIAKTLVAAIHLIDGDRFLQHNAFRAPGAASAEMLQPQPFKVDYFAQIYARVHGNIVAHAVFLAAENLSLLDGMDFVFLCIDRGAVKKLIIDRLEERGASFVDVGMGIERDDDRASLFGILRVTASVPEKRDQIARRVTFDDDGNDEYARNIQIAELNAMNAALAVIRWKKLQGVYADTEREMNSTYVIRTNTLVSDEQIDGA